MALRTRLSEASRQQLAANIDQQWFNELLECLRTTAALIERRYSASRPLTEMEHQSLNGSFREGATSIVEAIPNLAIPPKEKGDPAPEPFGKLVPETPNPKVFQPQPLKKDS